MVPGDAKADYCNRHIAMKDWPSDGQISESMGTIFLSKQKLISKIALEELFGDDYIVFLYTVWANTMLHSHWYENEDAAINSSDRKKILEAGGSVIKRMLHKQKRLPVALPISIE